MKPPEDISPSELFLKLSQSPRPTEVVDFPRVDESGKSIGQIRIQVLRMEEHDRARIMAQKRLKERSRVYGYDKIEAADMDSAGIREVLGDMTARELLAIACLDTRNHAGGDDEKPFYPRVFPDSDSIAQILSADETAVLFSAYLLVQDKYGPFERNLTSDADVDAWVQRLEEGASAFPLLHLPLPRLVELASSLAARTSTLFRILGSQWSSLPSTLKSDLESFSTAISYYGEQQDERAQTGSEKSLSDPVTIAQASLLAEATRI